MKRVSFLLCVASEEMSFEYCFYEFSIVDAIFTDQIQRFEQKMIYINTSLQTVLLWLGIHNIDLLEIKW